MATAAAVGVAADGGHGGAERRRVEYSIGSTLNAASPGTHTASSRREGGVHTRARPHLDGARCVHELEKRDFADEAPGHDAPRHRHLCALGHLAIAELCVQRLQLRRGVAAGEGVRIGLAAAAAQLLR